MGVGLRFSLLPATVSITFATVGLRYGRVSSIVLINECGCDIIPGELLDILGAQSCGGGFQSATRVDRCK